MTRLSIHCESCGRSWAARKAFTVYERQAVESCPCPGCGAYTLCCPESAGTPRRGRRPVWDASEAGVLPFAAPAAESPSKQAG